MFCDEINVLSECEIKGGSVFSDQDTVLLLDTPIMFVKRAIVRVCRVNAEIDGKLGLSVSDKTKIN